MCEGWKGAQRRETVNAWNNYLGSTGEQRKHAGLLDTRHSDAPSGLRWFVHRREEECSLKRHSEKEEEMPGIPSPSPFNLEQTS